VARFEAGNLRRAATYSGFPTYPLCPLSERETLQSAATIAFFTRPAEVDIVDVQPFTRACSAVGCALAGLERRRDAARDPEERKDLALAAETLAAVLAGEPLPSDIDDLDDDDEPSSYSTRPTAGQTPALRRHP
jgi:hypothetical protein